MAQATVRQSAGDERFRPVWHGVYLPEERPAILDADPHPRPAALLATSQKPEEPQSTGFTQVHVSGLPGDCEDKAVTDKLRQALRDGRRRAEDAFAAVAAGVAKMQCEESTAICAATDAKESFDIEENEAQSEHMESEARANDVGARGEVEDDGQVVRYEDKEEPFESCAVVRNKDTLICKGYCFLSFKTLAQAQVAVALLNEGVEVVGCEVKAELSQPKGQKAKPPAKAAPKQELKDMRIRRQRYQAVSSRAQHGHFSTTSGKTEDGEAHITRNSAGRINGITGTRGGNEAKLDDSKCSSQSGFKA